MQSTEKPLDALIAQYLQAVELVSAKQRDMTADPHIRIAACWLAIEVLQTVEGREAWETQNRWRESFCC